MKKRRSWKIKLTPEETARLAAEINDNHCRWIGEGYKLGKSSSFWWTSRGTVTARLVYRGIDPARFDTITVTIRGLVPA